MSEPFDPKIISSITFDQEPHTTTKRFCFDLETTGIYPTLNGIVQIAAIVDIDGKEVDSFTMNCNPRPCLVDPEALEVTSLSIEMIEQYPPQKEVYKKLHDFLSKHVNKYDREDKFYPLAYNGYFDVQFLHEFFIANNDEYYGSFFNHKLLDPMFIINILDYLDLIDTPDRKLSTVCKYYGVTLENAHDALEDVRAARALFPVVVNELSRYISNFKESIL